MPFISFTIILTSFTSLSSSVFPLRIKESRIIEDSGGYNTETVGGSVSTDSPRPTLQDNTHKNVAITNKKANSFLIKSSHFQKLFRNISFNYNYPL